jgi:hypothetical protein
MNTYWIIGGLLFILFFAVGETYAVRHRDRMNTLSRFIWQVGQKAPLTIFLMGTFAGGIAVHLFWNWDPNCMSSMGNG